jgi:transposase
VLGRFPVNWAFTEILRRSILRSKSSLSTTDERGGASILEPYKQIINDYLDQDDYQTTWIFDRIKKIGYPGSYDTVKHYVAGIKEQKTRLAYIRFETEPGLQAQFDWGDFQVQGPYGKKSTVYAFVLVLGYSRAMYVFATFIKPASWSKAATSSSGSATTKPS